MTMDNPMAQSELVVVTPQGRLDAGNTRPLEAEFKKHIAAGEVRLLVDLEATRYISSNGLRVILIAMKQAQKHHGKLVLCCLNPRMKEIFEMAGFDKVFEIFESRDLAFKALTR
jgi:anti-anti-sigma factor